MEILIEPQTMTTRMEREHLMSIIKIYGSSLIDVLLFAMAAWDGIDHVLRTISALGAIVVLIYLIRKHEQDYKLKKIEEEIKKIELDSKRKAIENEKSE